MIFLQAHHLSHGVTPEWLIQTGWQQEFADSSCLVLEKRWNLGSSRKVTLITAQKETKTWWLLQLLLRRAPFEFRYIVNISAQTGFTRSRPSARGGEIFIKAPTLPEWLIFTKLFCTFVFCTFVVCCVSTASSAFCLFGPDFKFHFPLA